MTIAIAEIRAAINIPETSELADIVITSAITRAASYIAVLRARYSAPSEYFSAAEMQYAIYLAYQAYSDRVLNVPPGNYESGKWDPIAEEIVRSTGDKLRTLQEAYKDIIDIIKSYPTRPYGTFASHTPQALKFTQGQFDYPPASNSDSGVW
jgi:hypothetical protein